MATILLINTKDLATYTMLGGNIDTDRQLSAIRDAQRTYLRPILGKDLYNKIMADFDSDTLTGIYGELFDDYVFDYVIHQACSLYLDYGAYQFTDAGITKAQPENTVAIGMNEQTKMVLAQRNLAKDSKDLLDKFLRENHGEIPEFKYECGSGFENRNGWFMPNYPLRYRGY